MSEFHPRYVGRDRVGRRDAFARMIACELRDPLMIADATLKQAEADLDPDQFATIAEAHARISQRLDDLSALARRGIAARDVQAVDLETVTRRRWERLQTGAAALTIDSTYQPRAEPQLFGLLVEQLLRSLLDYALSSHRSGVDSAGSTETANADTERAVESRPIVVAPGETSNGYGFYVGVDGNASPTAPSDPSVSARGTESVAGSEIIAAIGVAIEIVSAHGWWMGMKRGDDGVRIEVTTSEGSR